jgi:hypothetical protein
MMGMDAQNGIKYSARNELFNENHGWTKLIIVIFVLFITGD